MPVAKDKSVPRTVAEADQRGHPNADAPTKAELAQGRTISAINAKPGDVAWMGKCVNGKQTVCYYDSHMLPSDCRIQDC